MTARLLLAAAVFLVGVSADVVSTYVAVSSGRFVEGSPVGRYLIARHGLLSGMVLTKAIGMAIIGVPIALAGGTRRLVAAMMLGGVGVLSAVAALRNVLLVLGLWP
ncbi:hypothetical protein JCM18237_10770 [Halorubrum luteum]